MASDEKPAIPALYARRWEKFKGDLLVNGVPLRPEHENDFRLVFLSGYALGCTDTAAEICNNTLRGVKGGQVRSGQTLDSDRALRRAILKIWIPPGIVIGILATLGIAVIVGILLAKI